MAITKFLSDISIDGDLSSIGTIKTLTNGDGLVFSSPTTVKFKLGVYGANDLLFKDPSNNVLMSLTSAGNLGIGTTAPAQKLHVSGGHILLDNNKEIRQKDSGGTERTVFELDSSNDLNIGGSYAGALRFIGSGSYAEVMRIHDDGNVGIGTASPSYGLDVNHNAARIGSSSQTTTSLYLTATNTAGAPAVATQIIMQGYEGRAKGTFYTDSGVDGEWFDGIPYNGSHNYWQVGFDETGGQAEYLANAKLTVRDNGNVGIGTTSPSFQLSIENHTTTTSTATLEIDGKRTNGTDGSVGEMIFSNNGDTFATVAGFRDGADNKGSLQFQTQDSAFATRMTISSEGNVGIGTTTPQRILDVNVGGNSGVGASFAGTISAGEYQGIHFGYSEAGNGNYRHSAIVFERDDATHGDARGKIHILNSASGVASANLGDSRLTVLPSGNVGIATTSPNAKLDVVGNTRLGSGTLHVSTDQTFGTGFTYSFRDAVGILNPNGTSAASATAVMSIGAMSNGYSLVTTGNVGIGTTAPAQKLDVRGKMLVANDTPDAPVGSTLEVYRNGSTAELSIHQDNGSAGSAFSQLRFRNGGNDTYLKVPTSGQGLIIDTESQANALVISTTGNATFAGDVSLADSKKLILGAGNDLQIYHDGSHTHMANFTGNLRIRQFADDSDITFESDNGSGGTTEYFRLDGGDARMYASREIRFVDGVASKYGNSGDLGIYHDGTNSYLENDTGDLYIRNNYQDRDIIFQSDNGGGGLAKYIQIDGSTGAVELSHYGSKKFETYATGAGVTGGLYLTSGNYVHFDNGVTNNYAIRKSSTNLEFKTGGGYNFLSGNATFASDVTVTGNLIVEGTTTTLNTATVEVEDNILQLNTTQGTPDTATAATSGISVYRGDGVTQASLIFDDGDDTWDLTNNLNVAGSINAIGAIEVKDSDGSTTLSHVRAMSNTTEGWLSVSNGSNWGLIARGVANEPRLGAWYGGVLKIEGFHSSDGATGSNAIDFAQFQFGNNHFQMNAATSTFAGNVTLESASPVLKIDATGTGNPEIFFTRITGDDQNAKIRLLNNQLAFENEGDPDSSFLFQGRAAGAGSLSDFLKIEGTGITASGNITFGDSHTIGDDSDDNLVIASSASENIIIDSADDIILDAAGNDVLFKDAGTHIGTINMSSSNLTIESSVSDKDIIFKGKDGASAITALTLDMSEGGKATFAGRVIHNGIELTSGFAVDQIREFPMTFQLAADTWTDTGIDGADLSTGTYAMQVYVSDFEVGGRHYYEYYSATISWYGGATNSTVVDEIPVHRAGHAPNTGDLQFRTQRASGLDSHDLMLQVKTNQTYTGALDNDHGGKIMRFKFRRLM